jgi:hypothetical protein
METNNVWILYNCTYRSVYVKMWVTDSHIIQHWKFIKDKETVIILYTNNQGHIKAKDEGSSLLGCYTMFTGKQLPMFGRIIVPSSSSQAVQDYQATQCNISKELNHHQHCHENLKSYKHKDVWKETCARWM